VYFSTAHERTTVLQQRRIEILYHKFPEIFRGIIPENYRYFSGKIPEKFRRKFPNSQPFQRPSS